MKLHPFLSFLMMFVCAAQSWAQNKSEELIYQPVIKTTSITQSEVEEQYFRYTFRMGQLMPQNAEFTPHISAGVDFILPQGWYVGTEINYASWDNKLLSGNEVKDSFDDSAILSLAVGYELLQGSVFIADGMTLPWQVSTQVNIGHQVLNWDHARYVSGSLAWKANYEKYFVGLEWRKFSTNHAYLSRLSMNKGQEWSVLFGAYF